MQFTVDKKTIAFILQSVNRIAPSRPSHPILACFLFEVSESTLTVSAFDLAIGLKMSIPVFVLKEGKTCLSAGQLTKMVSDLPDGDIEFELKENKLKMSIGRSFRELATLSAEEYPKLPTVDDASSILLTAEALKAASGVMSAVSSDETKQVLTGVNLQVKEGGIKFAATDGHRLSIVTPSDAGYDPAFHLNITIPGKAFKELISIAANQEVKFSFDQGQAAFKGEGWELLSRTLDGTYPNYPQLIPTSFARTISVKRSEAIDAFSRLKSVLDDKTPIVKLTIDAETIVFRAEHAEVSNAVETIDCSLEGEPILIAFNAKYLADALRFTSSETIYIRGNNSTNPVIIHDDDDDGSLALLMPIQIRE